MPSITFRPSSSVERWLPAILLAALAVQFGWRSYRTHRVFNDTADEEIHIACGLEVWRRRQYTIEPQHPPLARLLVAALPYLAGGKPRGPGDWWESDDEEFYWRTLSLARAGNLVFLPVLLIWIYRWGREWYGPRAALGAAALVAFSPNLLAHASLATLDFGAAVTMFLASCEWWRWSRSPGRWQSSLRAGLALAAAVLTKFSALFIVPAMGLAFFGIARSFPGLRRFVLAISVALAAIWAGYGFSVRPLPSAQFTPPAGTIQESIQRAVERAAGDTPLPAPQFVRGVLDVLAHNAQGHASYLLGEVRTRGWWYYFPVALAVKTTLPLLILAAGGLASGRRMLGPAAAAMVVLGIAMLSNLNLGVRHVLAVYPLLALVAAAAFEDRRRRVAAAAFALLAWHGAESVRAHPDYLAYFNQTVRGREHQVLLDSNLDWGQDFERLRRYLAENRVESVHLSLFGRGEPVRRRIPGARPLPPHLRPAGWVAVSKAHLVGLALPGYDLGWLRAYQPHARIGRSILVYYFEEPPPL
jgi:hypothetical protein